MAEKRDTEIRELLSKIASLEDAYKDLEGTVTQFRELVLQLQTYVIPCIAYIHICVTDSSYSELDTLRTQTQTAQNESATAASQAAAMISLNMKLQSSAAKNLARNIELEIQKLEARESKELLGIVQVSILSIVLRSSTHTYACYSHTFLNFTSNRTLKQHTAISFSFASLIKWT